MTVQPQFAMQFLTGVYDLQIPFPWGTGPLLSNTKLYWAVLGFPAKWHLLQSNMLSSGHECDRRADRQTMLRVTFVAIADIADAFSDTT